MIFGRWLLAAALAATPGLAPAQEGSGCGAFRWSLDHERAALIRPDKPSLANGGALAYDVAMTLELAPLSAAGLPKAPERAPRSPQSFAGHFTLRRAGEAGRLQADDLVGKLDRRPRRRRLPASDRVHRRNLVRGRAQERQVRLAVPSARDSVQRRQGRARFPSSSRPTNSPSRPRRRSLQSSRPFAAKVGLQRSRTSDDRQCRKCRIPVKTIAMSRFVGDCDHVRVAHRSAGLDDRGRAGFNRRNEAVGEREEGVGGDDRASRARLGPTGDRRGFLGLARGEARGIDPRHLARADAHSRPVPGVDDGVRLHMLGDAPMRTSGRPFRLQSARVWSRP